MTVGRNVQLVSVPKMKKISKRVRRPKRRKFLFLSVQKRKYTAVRPDMTRSQLFFFLAAIKLSILCQLKHR